VSEDARPDRARGRALAADLVVAALAIAWLVRLAAFARGSVFQSDECFHAYVSGWIAAHGRLPRDIPGLYSGFAYFYPPLFHVLGAVWIRFLGTGALSELNVAVTGVALLAVWNAARTMAGRDAARWAAVLVMTSAGIAQYATRLYVEATSTLLTILAFTALATLERRGRVRDVLALGIASGLAWLAKPSALALPALWLVLAALAAWRGRRALARGLVVASGIAAAIASPYWLRDWALFGSPFYPAGAPDRHPLIDRLNQSTFSLAPLDFARQMAAGMGPWIALAALVVVLVGGRGGPTRRIAVAIGVCVLLMTLAPLQPMVEPRHLNPLVAALAILGAVGLTDATRAWPRVAAGIGLVLVLAAATTIVVMPNPRGEFDPDPAVTEACAAARRIVPVDATVLSLWTYDTFYHAGRNATWPIPWGQRDHPVEMFLTSDCDSVATACARHGIGWVMMPADTPGDSIFDAANYPRSFVGCMTRLTDARRARVAWRSAEMELIQLLR
jgi:4-amino-4-deoxy-L-arabinose transferase-like glycosyltransferase